MNYKLLRDPFNDSSDVLLEATSIINSMSSLEYCLSGAFKRSWVEKNPGKSEILFKAKYLQLLRSSAIAQLKTTHPKIYGAVENGRLDNLASNRLFDALGSISKFNDLMESCGGKPEATETVNKLTSYCRDGLGSMAVFVILQYRLYSIESGELLKCVEEYCARAGQTPEDFYNDMKEIATSFTSIYGYEPCSTYYDILCESYANLIADAMEVEYPLVDSVCEKLLRDPASLGALMEKISAFDVENSEGQKVISDGKKSENIIQALNLD